jgi:hypothetical protein
MKNNKRVKPVVIEDITEICDCCNDEYNFGELIICKCGDLICGFCINAYHECNKEDKKDE